MFAGAGTPRAIVLEESAVARAGELGANVASQLGRPFDEAEYRGDPGLCPLCHLSVVELVGTSVACATCGARGELTPQLTVRWTDLSPSVIGMAEKRAHSAEIQETAQAHAPLRPTIDERAAAFAAYDRRVTPRQTLETSS
jgi:hypothetical protein